MKKQFFLFVLLNSIIISGIYSQQNISAAFEVKVVGQGQPLFLIPGAGCSGEVWTATLDKYAAHYTCHVFTLAGYAGVPPLESMPYLPNIEDALVQYIKANSDGNALLMGHSIGGYLSLLLGSRYPDLFAKIVVVDGLPFLAAAQNPLATEENVRQMMLPTLEQYQSLDSLAYVQQQRQVLQTMIKGNADLEMALTWSLASDKTTLAHSVFEMMCRDLRQDLATMNVPTLVLGAYDGPYEWAPHFTKDLVTQTYTSQYAKHPNCIVKIPDHTRHFVMLDNPEWFFTQVEQFLKD